MNSIEKLLITDPVTGKRMKVPVAAPLAAKAKSDPAIMSQLIQLVFKTQPKTQQKPQQEIQQKKESLNTQKLVPLVLNDISEKYTIMVEASEWHRAMENPLHAAKILQNHKDAINKQARHALSTNDAMDQSSSSDENQFMTLPIFDDVIGKDVTLRVSRSEYEQLLKDNSFGRYLLAKHRENLDKPATSATNDTTCDQEEFDDSDSENASTSQSENNTKKNKFRWNENQTQLLLSLYEENDSRLDDGSLTSRRFWTILAEGLKKKGYSFTLQQCQTRMDHLKRTYKLVKDYNMTTGNSKKTCQYYDQLDKIFHKKPWIKPLSVSGSNIPMKNIDDCNAIGKNKRRRNSQDMDRPEYMRQCLENQQLRLTGAENYRNAKLKILKDFTEVLKPNK